MKSNFNLKKRESKNLTPERLHEILSETYSDSVADELLPELIKGKDNEKGGEDNA